MRSGSYHHRSRPVMVVGGVCHGTIFHGRLPAGVVARKMGSVRGLGGVGGASHKGGSSRCWEFHAENREHWHGCGPSCLVGGGGGP